MGDKMIIDLDNHKYIVEIVRKKTTRNTYIRVKENNIIYITTNIRTKDKDIIKLINENKLSILKMISKQNKKDLNNKDFWYLGQNYEIVLTNSNTITLGDEKVFIGKNVDIDKWYKKQAKTIFLEHFNDCYNRFSRNIIYPSLVIRKMKSRWGVCNTKLKKVTLNLELIKRDTVYLDYVIYHELSHLIEGNHSSRFWSIVEENCPNYKNIRKRMKDF